MRLLFTGGSGKAGRHVVPYLHEQGHRILNLDVTPLRFPGVTDALADITDLGQVYSVLNSYAGFDEIDAGSGRRVFDAVVHFAASVLSDTVIPAEPETWRINVMGTFNILEAATKMGVRKIVIASSETAYGMCLADGMPNPDRLPLEEDFMTSPSDAYGLSKRVCEVTAAGFQKRTGADIYALRIGNVQEPGDYAKFPAYAKDPGLRRRLAFSYIDARDLGQMVDLCLGRDGLGFQIFNASANETCVPQPNSELIARYFPGVTPSRELGEHESLLSNRKIRDMLGYKERHSWRDQIPK